MFRRLIDGNIAVCRAINKRLPEDWRTDGNYWFQQNVLATGISPGDTVFDLGGGSRPWISPGEKTQLDLTVVGLDIDATELCAAPSGSYDEIIATDLCSFLGNGTADKVICQATLEHVPDTAGAIRAIASILKPGGQAYIFAPGRNALFARLNRALPESIKKRVLALLYPYAGEGHDGFQSYYDQCTPSSIEALARANGLEVTSRRTFWVSGYFYAFVPAYLAWRIIQRFARMTSGDDACETFCVVLRKRGTGGEEPRARVPANRLISEGTMATP